MDLGKDVFFFSWALGLQDNSGRQRALMFLNSE